MNKETSLYQKFKEAGKFGVIFGIGAVLQKAISFVLIPVYTKYFIVADYGKLGLIRVTAQIFSSIFSLGLISALFRSYYDYEDEENRSKVISTAFFMLLISCSIFFIISIFCSKPLSILILNDSKYSSYFFIIFISSIFGVFNGIPFAVFRARKKPFQFIIFQTSFLLIGIGIIIYLVVYKSWGIKGSLFGSLLMQIISFIVLFLFIRKSIKFTFFKHEAKKMILFGLPLVPANLAGFIFNSSDRFILKHYSNFQEVGLYNLGYQFGMILMILFVMPIRLVWGPLYLSYKDDKNAKDFYSGAFTYVVFLGAIFFLGLSLLSKEIIQIFSNKEYWDAYRVIPLVTLAYLFWSVEIILNVGIGLKRKTKVVMIYMSIGAISNIILNFILIPDYGMMGAAFATLISFIIMLVIVFCYNRKFIKINYEWNRIIKIALVTLLIFIVGNIIKIDNVLLSIIYKFGIILSYPFILLLLKFYSISEIQKVKQIVVSSVMKVKGKIYFNHSK